MMCIWYKVVIKISFRLTGITNLEKDDEAEEDEEEELNEDELLDREYQKK